MRRSGTVRPPGAYELSEGDSDGGDR